MRRWKYVEVEDMRRQRKAPNVEKVIEEYESKGWHLHTYQFWYRHRLLFEREDTGKKRKKKNGNR